LDISTAKLEINYKIGEEGETLAQILIPITTSNI